MVMKMMEKKKGLGRGLESLLPARQGTGRTGIPTGSSGKDHGVPLASSGKEQGVPPAGSGKEPARSHAPSKEHGSRVENAASGEGVASGASGSVDAAAVSGAAGAGALDASSARGLVDKGALAGAREIALELIERNPYQTRGKIDEAALEELAASIREQGVLQPVLVREIRGQVSAARSQEDPTLRSADASLRVGQPTAGGSGTASPTLSPALEQSPRGDKSGAHIYSGSDGAVIRADGEVIRTDGGVRYQLLAGERRWLAARRAGLKVIPAMVKQVNDEQAMEITIIENLQREDLNPMEQARAFERLSREFRLTQELIALKTGKERATIANFLRLLKLPAMVQQAIEDGTLSLGHGKALMALHNESSEMVQRVAEKAMADGTSVRQLEEMVQRLLSPRAAVVEAPADERDPNVKAAEKLLQNALGCRVTVKDKGGRGKIVVEYASLEDFDRVVEVLGK